MGCKVPCLGTSLIRARSLLVSFWLEAKWPEEVIMEVWVATGENGGAADPGLDMNLAEPGLDWRDRGRDIYQAAVGD